VAKLLLQQAEVKLLLSLPPMVAQAWVEELLLQPTLELLLTHLVVTAP
jgi:hypothetical protein